MAEMFGIRGLLTLDISQALINLDKVQARIERFVQTSTNLFDKIQASGMSSEFASLGKQVGIFAISATVMSKAFTQGFADIKQAGGEAFDYVGSRAEELTKKAIIASSEMERFQRTTALFEKTKERTASVVSSTLNIAQNSPFELKDVTRASLSLQSRGFRGDDVEKYLKVAGELAAARGKGIDQMAEGLGRLKSNSAEGFRSLKTNAGISPEMLQKEGIVLDSGGRLRIRNSGDTDLVLAAIERITTKMTGNKAATEQADTAAGKWTATLNKATVVLSRFGDIIAPSVKAVIDKFSEFLDYVDKLDPATKKMIANVVAFAGAAFALAAALGPPLAIIGTMASGFVSLGIGVVSAGFAIKSLLGIVTSGLFTTGIANLANFIRNATIAKTIETIVPGTAAINKFAMGPNNTKYRYTILGTAATTTSSVVRQAVPGAAAAGDAVEGVGAAITSVGSKVSSAFATAFNLMKTLGGGILEFFVSPLGILVSTVAFLANRMFDAQAQAHEAAGKIIEDESRVAQARAQQAKDNRFDAMSPAEQTAYLEKDSAYAARRNKATQLLMEKGRADNTQLSKPNPYGTVDFLTPEAKQPSFGPDMLGAGDLAGQQFGSDNANTFNSTKAKLNENGEQGAAARKALADSSRFASKEKTAPEQYSTQALRNMQTTFKDQEKLGYLSKLEYFNKEQDLLKKMRQSHDTEDEIRKQKLQVQAAAVSQIHQLMYEKIDVARNKDVAREELSLNKKKGYLEDEIAIIEKSTITREDLAAKVAAATKKVPSLGLFPQFASKEQIDARNKVLNYNAGLQDHILDGYKWGVRSDEQIKFVNSKRAEEDANNLSQERENSKFKAQNFTNTGNSLGAGLETAAQKYRDELRQFQGNKERMRVIEAQHNLEVKKLYLEDFIAWRTIQQQKIDTDVKIKANRRGRELDRMKFDKSQYSEDNLEEQTKSVQKAADEQIKALKDKEARETEILNKKIAVEESTRKPGAKKNQKQEDAEKDLYNLKNNTKDEIEAIKQNTGITSESNTEKKKSEDRDDEVKQRNLDLRKAEFKEQILQKKMDKAKTPEDLDKMARKQEEITKNEYKAELDILNLQTAKDLAAHSKDPAEQARILADYKLKEVELQEKYVQKLEDATSEMEKQKALLQSAADDKGKFTMGGIYNSYDEAMKGDQADADLFSQRQNESGNNTDQMKRLKATSVLGIPSSSPTDVFNSPVLAAQNKADKDKYAGGYPSINGTPYQNIKGKEWDKEHGVVEVKLYLNDKLQSTQTQTRNVAPKNPAMNHNNLMGGLSGGMA